MSLRRVIAAPFKQSGEETMSRQEIVVALSLHRDWFSPAQAKQAIERAEQDGLLRGSTAELTPTFDPGAVQVPESFTPDSGVLSSRSPFEVMVDALAEELGEKREAVARINRLQTELAVPIEAAAAIEATRLELDVTNEVQRAKQQLIQSTDTENEEPTG